MEAPWKVRLTGVGILLVGVVIAGVAYSINRGDQERIDTYTKQQLAMQQVAVQAQQPTPTPTIALTQEPVVTIDNETALPVERRKQLYDRIISPLLDYYQSADLPKVLTVTLQANTTNTATQYPYAGLVKTTDGAELGFVVEQKGSSIQWWKPECLGTCNFTPEYKAKYPQVVQ